MPRGPQGNEAPVSTTWAFFWGEGVIISFVGRLSASPHQKEPLYSTLYTRGQIFGRGPPLSIIHAPPDVSVVFLSYILMGACIISGGGEEGEVEAPFHQRTEKQYLFYLSIYFLSFKFKFFFCRDILRSERDR